MVWELNDKVVFNDFFQLMGYGTIKLVVIHKPFVKKEVINFWYMQNHLIKYKSLKRNGSD